MSKSFFLFVERSNLDKDNSKARIYPPACYTTVVRFATSSRQHWDDAGERRKRPKTINSTLGKPLMMLSLKTLPSRTAANLSQSRNE